MVKTDRKTQLLNKLASLQKKTILINEKLAVSTGEKKDQLEAKMAQITLKTTQIEAMILAEAEAPKEA